MRGRAFAILLFVLAAGLFAGLAIVMRQAQRTAVAAAEQADPVRPPRPVTEVASAVRAMKLVSVEIDTRVKVERGDESWRGDVMASVVVPVRLYYGTDLSKLSGDAVAFSPLIGAGSYVVRIPPPTRIATEVFSEREQVEVSTGWLRLRSRAGEYYLGLARRDASDQARDLALLPADEERVERETKERVGQLVRSIVGERAKVEVVIAGGP